MNRTREQKQGLEEEKEPGSFTDSGEKERVLPPEKGLSYAVIIHLMLSTL